MEDYKKLLQIESHFYILQEYIDALFYILDMDDLNNFPFFVACDMTEKIKNENLKIKEQINLLL